VTLYTQHLDLPLGDYMDLIDVITLWTWKSSEIAHLEANLKKVQRAYPKHKIIQGCYMYDFSRKQPVGTADMKIQCETGLRWLKEGRTEGMIFLANTVADFDFDSVEWTRNWIAEVADNRLPSA
jgi:hypothetical protein